MKMRVLTVLALDLVLGTSIGVYGQALQKDVSNTTSVSTSFASVFVQDTVTVTRSVIVSPFPPFKTSPGQTSTVAQSITTANPSTSIKPSSTLNPFRACWATGECKRLLIEFTMTYNESGKITDPNEHDPKGRDQSHNFQRQLCSVRQYENVVIEKPPDQRPMNFLICMSCFKQAGLDTNTANSPTLNVIYKIDGFCHTSWPNAYDVLDTLYNFMLKSEAPTSMPELPAEITGLVPSLKTKFTWTSDMNRKTSAGAAPTSTPLSTTGTESPPLSTSDPILPWLGSPLTPGASLPAHLLAQIPANWPYTAYGMRYRSGPIASMPLTWLDPLAIDNATQTVAWLYHSLVWNPRPLYTPPSARLQTDTLYQPLLDEWTRSATWETTRAGAKQGISQPTATQQSNKASGMPAEPTITQLSVLPINSDTPGESSHAQSVENGKLGSDEEARSKSGGGGRAGVMGVVTRVANTEDEGEEYRDLMGVIASMRSRLDGGE